MQLTTLGELPVGALFTRHDEYGDGTRIYAKLGAEPAEGTLFSGSCWCGSPQSGPVGYYASDIPVQHVSGGKDFDDFARRLCGTRPSQV